ncbi:MAG TPA: hypothetical protein VNF68_03210 [Candidatus Baltobacteraceae bacterium]|nr:hypothetical protein [Candidatus Baltobacteraceae bacterium]
MLLALLLSTINATTAATPAHSTTYRTTIVRRFDSYGSNGTLKLWFPANGYVRGTYTADDGGFPSTVTGGRDGSKIWLDFQALGGLHIEGTFENGAIHGLGTKRIGRAVFVFTAIPGT